MINKNNIKTLFNELNEALKSKGQSREFTIFGSGALLIQGLASESRATIDVDMVDPKIDMDLQIICSDVGKKYNLDITWLNSAGYIYSLNFPDGWRERVKTVYIGDSLKVKSLARKDLIATKIYAACSRQIETDLIDLKKLNPNQDELNFAKKWISLRPDYEELKPKLDSIVGTFTRGRGLV